MPISYAPLRKYLKENKLSPNKLYELGIITTNTATKINNDQTMNLSTIDTICQYLNVPIEQVVEIIPDEPDGKNPE